MSATSIETPAASFRLKPEATNSFLDTSLVASGFSRKLQLSQFRHPSYFDPLDHEDVAVVVEARAVRTDELARDELLARLAAQRILPARVRIPELRDQCVA